MTLKEFLSNKASLFETIKNIEPFPFIGSDADKLDLILRTNYGSRQLFAAYEDFTITELAEILVIEFIDRWQDYVKMAALVQDVNNKRELTETINNTEDRTNNSSTTNKVSAYNSETLIDDDGNEVTGTDGLEGEKTRTLTDTDINVEKAFNMLNKANQTSIIRSVVKDISSATTLTIY